MTGSPHTFSGFLTGNALKILAAVFMTIDHMGLMLFPGVPLFRILGRLALPIFAYMIAEGCKYTRNRKRYFAMVFGLGVICQTVYFFFDGSMYLSILITFSLSILTVYSLQYARAKNNTPGWLVFAGTAATVYMLNQILTIDYGFWGCMLPVFAALPHGTKWDSRRISCLALGLGLIPLALSLKGYQVYALLALPLLLCYNGSRGKWNMKYFFYIFYPTHLVILQALAMIPA
ncbi:MAG: hypothetical protein IKU68_01760 [Oscillospiraceae bacterium]|nr:hypothetical protein [Oscillospiraceae bacterium]